MTVLDDVRSFIARLAPDAVCDDCTSDRLKLSVRQHANHGGFELRKGPCSLCGGKKLVIRKT